MLIAPSADVAATLLSTPGYVTAAFILPRQGADVAADADRVVEGIATSGPPRPHLPAVFANSTGLNLTALAGIIVGILIAVNTVLLAVEDRRAVMGTIGAISTEPAGLFGGMLGEGAVVGLLRGVSGRAKRFPARRISRGQIRAVHVGRLWRQHRGAAAPPNLIVIGAAAGVVCGVLAMFGPAARLARDGPLASMASIGGVQRARTIPMWPLIAGAGLLAAAVVLLKIVERGSLPLSMGINGLTVGLCGVVLVTAWIAPRASGLSSGLLTKARPAVGRLLGADIRRYTRCCSLSPPRYSPRAPAWLSARTACNCSAPSRSPRRRPTACPPPADQRTIGARSARRPNFRPHIRVGDRRRGRAERFVALAVDNLVGDVVARGRRRHAGRLVQPSTL